MTRPTIQRRASCAACLRPQAACICRWVRPVEHAVEVLILQHPMEVHQAKGSARLLHLSLPRSRLEVGEAFDHQVLQQLLYAPFESDPSGSDGRVYPVLLYPQTPQVPGDEPDAHAAFEPGGLPHTAVLRLVVLDGTWRKSRKMLHLSPLLRRLPRLALHEVPSSRYLIRKARGAHQLSTLEAACHALTRLEGDAGRYAPLLAAFDGFVGQQAAYRPSGGEQDRAIQP